MKVEQLLTHSKLWVRELGKYLMDDNSYTFVFLYNETMIFYNEKTDIQYRILNSCPNEWLISSRKLHKQYHFSTISAPNIKEVIHFLGSCEKGS